MLACQATDRLLPGRHLHFGALLPGATTLVTGCSPPPLWEAHRRCLDHHSKMGVNTCAGGAREAANSQ